MYKITLTSVMMCISTLTFADIITCYPEKQSHCFYNTLDGSTLCTSIKPKTTWHVRNINIDTKDSIVTVSTWGEEKYITEEKELLKMKIRENDAVITFKTNYLTISHLIINKNNFVLSHDLTPLPVQISQHNISGTCE